jgi:vacuolar iron transporter family protein
MDSQSSTLQPEPKSEIQRKISDSEPRMPHHEDHKNPGPYMRDVIIGFSDGLTVPFALTAGLSS